MTKDFIKNIAVLLVFNIVVFFIYQNLILPSLEQNYPLVLNTSMAFIVNTIVSLGVYLCIVSLQKIFESQIGFIFLGLSVLKMIFLYILLNPTNQTGSVSQADALTFFIPFGLNLVLELLFIVKLLKINELSK